MCLILFAWKAHEKYPLIVAANRDEFKERPTKGVHWWEGEKNILAGKDLKAGGTWMGMDRNGRFSAVTNYREFPITKTYDSSRGELVTNFIQSEVSCREYLNTLQETKDKYEGYNLIFGNREELFYFSNKSENNGKVDPGIHGLSNHLLNTPWPKVVRGKDRMSGLLNQNNLGEGDLFKLLSDKNYAADEELPDTGIGFEKEKQLSSMFIDMEGYGTRSSSVLKIDNEGEVTYTERTTVTDNINRFEFRI